MSLPDLSIRRPVLATVMTLALVLLGLVSLFRMNVNEYPNMSFPYVTVQINYDGAQPEQIDNQIVRKVEEAVSEAKGVRHISSVSREGTAEIGVEFNMEINAAEATQDVRDKLGSVRGELPTGIEEPVVARYDMNAEPVAAIALTSDRLTQRELSILVDDQVKPALQQIPGVGQLSIVGKEEREIQLLLRPEALMAYSLSPSELAERIAKDITEVPGGTIDDGRQKLSVSTRTGIKTPQDFSGLMVAERGGHPVYFRQLGEVADTIKDRTSLARYDNVPAIGIEVGKQSGSNAVKVAEAVKKKLAQIRESLPEGVDLHIVRDDARRIQDVIHEVWRDLILGGIFAVLVVFLFLGDIRSALIIALTIPTSLTASFFFMYVAGFSINTMSMLGLTLSIGLLIDDAIVVIENVIRHLKQGALPLEAAARGTNEIILAVMATTFGVVAVFFPMGFMTGITGEFFKEFGLTIAFAVLVSLFISFTLIPMLASKYLRPAREKENGLWRMQRNFSRKVDDVAATYAVCLEKILAGRRKQVAAAGLLLFFCSLALLPFIGMDMMPASDKGQFSVKYQLQDGVSLDSKDELSREMTKMLAGIKGVEHVYTTNSTRNEQEFFVQLLPRGKRDLSQAEIITRARRELNALPGVRISIEGLSDMGSKPVEVSLVGPDIHRLGEASDQVVQQLEQMPGVIDITSSYRPGSPRLSIRAKETRAHDLGVSNDAIGTTVGILLEGKKTGKFNDTDEQVDVRLRLLGSSREKPSQLDYIQVPTSRGEEREASLLVPLSSVAEWKYDTNPSAVQRYERQKEVRISANLEGVSLGEFEDRFAALLETMELPPGVQTGSAGEANEMDETMDSIVTALVLGIAFIFMILAAQFESWTEPFAIMAALPMAFIGALLGLLICRSTFSMISGIGILLLMGLVTKNAILLVDFAKKRIAEGVSCEKALAESGQVRFRPIMMTTLSTMLGMAPVALAIGNGAETRAPMAHAILGGLVTSTLLTLVVIPCLYSLLHGWMGGKRNGEGNGII